MSRSSVLDPSFGMNNMASSAWDSLCPILKDGGEPVSVEELEASVDSAREKVNMFQDSERQEQHKLHEAQQRSRYNTLQEQFDTLMLLQKKVGGITNPTAHEIGLHEKYYTDYGAYQRHLKAYQHYQATLLMEQEVLMEKHKSDKLLQKQQLKFRVTMHTAFLSQLGNASATRDPAAYVHQQLQIEGSTAWVLANEEEVVRREMDATKEATNRKIEAQKIREAKEVDEQDKALKEQMRQVKLKLEQTSRAAIANAAAKAAGSGGARTKQEPAAAGKTQANAGAGAGNGNKPPPKQKQQQLQQQQQQQQARSKQEHEQQQHQQLVSDNAAGQYEERTGLRDEILKRCLSLGKERKMGSQLWRQYWQGFRSFVISDITKQEFDTLLKVTLQLPEAILRLHYAFVGHVGDRGAGSIDNFDYDEGAFSSGSSSGSSSVAVSSTVTAETAAKYAAAVAAQRLEEEELQKRLEMEAEADAEAAALAEMAEEAAAAISWSDDEGPLILPSPKSNSRSPSNNKRTHTESLHLFDDDVGLDSESPAKLRKFTAASVAGRRR